jgi:hypothetical protein
MNKTRRNKNGVPTIVSRETKQEALTANLKTNWIFYIVAIGCMYILSFGNSNTSFCSTVFTFIGASVFGYIMHYISHFYKFKLNYQESNSMCKDYWATNSIAEGVCALLDYHDDYHHDTEINKQWLHVTLEFVTNFIIQGLYPAAIIQLCSYLDIRIVLLWGVFYATFHIINYSIVKPNTHKDHHFHSDKNYGLDIHDIIFGTKCDWTDIEDYNHYSINLILLTGALAMTSCFFASGSDGGSNSNIG